MFDNSTDIFDRIKEHALHDIAQEVKFKFNDNNVRINQLRCDIMLHTCFSKQLSNLYHPYTLIHSKDLCKSNTLCIVV